VTTSSRRRRSALDDLASALGRRDEFPNKELARRLAGARDRAGIREIVTGLTSAAAGVAPDCIKVLYEVGEIDPELIGGFAPTFRALLTHRNNRLVWGGMTALNVIAGVRADEVYRMRHEITAAIERGSVITADNGVQALARVAAARPSYSRALAPYLLEHLAVCRPKDVASRAEKIFSALAAAQREELARVLTRRRADLTASGRARVDRVLRRCAASC
jgi:hypothetical protein